jgi:hypothetical protein
MRSRVLTCCGRAVKAADVDRDHFLAVGARAARERFDAARRAQQVMDHLLVDKMGYWSNIAVITNT